MHEELVGAELKWQRAKAAKDTTNPLAHRYEVGHLVMVTVRKISVNPVCTDKMRCQ